jgi:D-threonate/D-erythronate kinase
MRVTLIADDLTGACDAAAPFAGRGRVGVFVAPAWPGSEWEVAAVDTESRGLEPVEATALVRAAVERLGARLAQGLVFKKIDSTLRGAVGAELEALLAASGRATVLLCPSFPDQARTVVNGTLLVNGAFAHESPIGRDPAYPGPTSDVAEIVRHGAGRPVSVLSLARVRGEPEHLAQALGAARGGIVVADAERDDDLDRLARAAVGRPDVALAGSAGLARAVAMALGHAGPPAPLPEGRAWLIVAGSLHPATRAQLQRLEAAGVTGVRLGGAGDPATAPLIAQIKEGRPVFITTEHPSTGATGERPAMASRLARVAARVLAESRPDLVAVTGGETAVALLRVIGAAHVEISGAPASGLALGDAIADVSSSAVPLLTKAGGFGPPELFLALMRGGL